jgi:N6-adenosine-specific RNA methylase IME4/ParB-like chromosome segregation protein Spo0J
MQNHQQITMLQSEQLQAHPKNPRLIMREDVIDSIRAGLKNGFLPCYALQVWQGQVLSGHHRLEAAKREGIGEVPCFVRDELTEGEAYMVLATANAQGELSPLEEGLHFNGSGQGVREYARLTGQNAGGVTQKSQAAQVFSQLNTREDMRNKTQHLAAIHKLPQECWAEAAHAMLARGWSAKETGEQVVIANGGATLKRKLALLSGATTIRELARIDETAQRVTDSLEYEETRQEWADWLASEDPTDIKQLQAKRVEIETKEADRREAEREKGAGTTGKPNLILADPPWKYDFAETDSRQIENQYPTGTVPEIAAYMRKEMLAEDTEQNCVLFLWATVAKMTEAFEIIEELGFQYKTCAVWDKEKIGMGYWFRGQHELLLVATRGKFSPPAEENRISSVFREARGKHSAKPECVYQWIEQAFPDACKMEIFQRSPRESWIGKGNEA